MFTLSKATEQKLEGIFVYGIDDLARLLPSDERKNPRYLLVDGMFGVYSNIGALQSNGAKNLTIATPGFWFLEIPIPK